MALNSMFFNRKRKGSVAIILIIMIFGSLLVLANMSAVSEGRLFKEIQLKPVNYQNIE